VNPAPAAPPAFIDESYDPAEAEVVVFKGWARMACAVLSLEITEVKRPKLGEMVSHHFISLNSAYMSSRSIAVAAIRTTSLAWRSLLVLRS
jgi:hypothetical protein